MKKLIALSVLLVCAFSVSVGAAVVYSQPPDTTNPTGYYSDADFPQFEADDFVLSADYQITDVHWWGVYASTDTPQASDDFTIEFYSDISGTPPSPMAVYNVGHVGRTDTGYDYAGWDIYYYNYDLPTPLSLAGGTTYYLSIYNDTTVDADDDWCWMTGEDGNSMLWYRHSLSDPWDRQDYYDFAFELTTSDGQVIPEPITSVLFAGSVLFGLARLRRRRS